MPRQETIAESSRFGRYLRRIREERRLSLDSVEEMSASYPERVTKSHLSRIENGRAVPTFPRMFTLSQIYGVPVASLADRFEVELKRSMATETYQGMSWVDLKAEADRLRIGGRYVEALMLMDRLLDRPDPPFDADAIGLRIDRVVCLYQIGRYSLSKEEAEELLRLDLDDTSKVRVLQLFIVASYRLGKYTVAWMGLEHAFRLIEKARDLPPRLPVDFLALRGSINAVLGDYKSARVDYDAALDGFDRLGLPFEVCRYRINTAAVLIELGEFDEAQSLLMTALREAESGPYDLQSALALSNLGLIAFRQKRYSTAENILIRSNAIGRPREYTSCVFRNCYYLWLIARERSESSAIIAHERSLRSYLGRVEEPLSEVESYRAYLSGVES